MTMEGYTISNQVYVPDRLKPGDIFESTYIGLRQKEQRLYADKEVALLPVIDGNHVHAKEWIIRRHSAERLIKYLSAKKPGLRILEVGCGNGWLCKMLASLPGSKVIGIDINYTELQQAARVFQEIQNLFFIYGTLESGIPEGMEFDCIIFASCIQYFNDLSFTLEQGLRLLKAGGEIHILDSPFYVSSAIPPAKKRTQDYYASLGYGEMSRYYFHHDVKELESFQPDFLYNPSFFGRLFTGHGNPFPWIRIKQSALQA